MNIIDSILLLLLSLFGLRGYFKGLFRETFSVLGLVFGFLLSLRYEPSVATALAAYQAVPPFALKPITFVALFIAIYLAFCLAGWLIHRFSEGFRLHGVDRFGGLLVGTGKGIAVLGFLLFLLHAFPLLPRPVLHEIRQSYLARPLVQFAGGILKSGKKSIFLPQALQEGEVDRAGSI